MDFFWGLWEWVPGESAGDKIVSLVKLGGAITIGWGLWRWTRGRDMGTRLGKIEKALINPPAPLTSDMLDRVAEILAKKLVREAHGPGYLKSELSQRDEQIKALTLTIKNLRVGAARNEPGMAEAYAKFEKGDTAEAEALYTRIGEEKAAEGLAASKEAAEVFRNVGNIAFLHDTAKAMRAYVRARELDPDNAVSWNQLGHLQLRIGELGAATASYEKVLALGKRSANNALIAKAIANLGVIYEARGKLPEAEGMLISALTLFKRLCLQKDEAIVSGNLGNVYGAQGDLVRAKDMYIKALKVFRELDCQEGMANQYGNLGVVAFSSVPLPDLAHAEEMFTKALAIDMRLGNKAGMANQYGNLGNIYLKREDFVRAEEMYTKSLKLNEELGRKEGMAIQISNIGIIYFMCGELVRAEEMYTKSLKLNKALSSQEGIAANYDNLGLLHEQKGNLAKACAHWRKSRALYAELGAPHMVEKVEGWLREANCPAQ